VGIGAHCVAIRFQLTDFMPSNTGVRTRWRIAV
jgi:hypothetical protein